MPSRSQSRSRKPAPPKKPPPKKRALPVENLSSDSDSSLSDSDDSGVGFIVPTKHKAQPSQAAIERARRASQGRREASSSEGRREEESKPSSQAVERAKAASMRAKMAHKPAPPKGPAPPWLGLPPLSVLLKVHCPGRVHLEGRLPEARGRRGGRRHVQLVVFSGQDGLATTPSRKDSWRDVHQGLEERTASASRRRCRARLVPKLDARRLLAERSGRAASRAAAGPAPAARPAVDERWEARRRRATRSSPRPGGPRARPVGRAGPAPPSGASRRRAAWFRPEPHLV